MDHHIHFLKIEIIEIFVIFETCFFNFIYIYLIIEIIEENYFNNLVASLIH
jgi:hypothetical protein